jgi:hypothetical protein
MGHGGRWKNEREETLKRASPAFQADLRAKAAKAREHAQKQYAEKKKSAQENRHAPDQQERRTPPENFCGCCFKKGKHTVDECDYFDETRPQADQDRFLICCKMIEAMSADRKTRGTFGFPPPEEWGEYAPQIKFVAQCETKLGEKATVGAKDIDGCVWGLPDRPSAGNRVDYVFWVPELGEFLYIGTSVGMPRFCEITNATSDDDIFVEMCKQIRFMFMNAIRKPTVRELFQFVDYMEVRRQRYLKYDNVSPTYFHGRYLFWKEFDTRKPATTK